MCQAKVGQQENMDLIDILSIKMAQEINIGITKYDNH